MSDTRRALVRRTAAMLALTAAAVGALFAAYGGVHGTAAPLREETAPAILDVTAAQNALHQAWSLEPGARSLPTVLSPPSQV